MEGYRGFSDLAGTKRVELGDGETAANRAKTTEKIGGDSNGSGTKWVGSIQKTF